LVALLLRAGEPVPDDVLVETLWGENAPPSARKALQVQVSRLRARLDAAAERLVTTAAGYRLDVAPGEIDAARFEALCARAGREEPGAAAVTLGEALALWRGPALADLRYEAFVQGEIARLEERDARSPGNSVVLRGPRRPIAAAAHPTTSASAEMLRPITHRGANPWTNLTPDRPGESEGRSTRKRRSPSSAPSTWSPTV
jgi:hypothetical protein